jgi:hypothetical protein
VPSSYAGVGSRETPDDVLEVMETLGYYCAEGDEPVILRSGGAIGADQAFERGCDRAKGEKEIFLASHCTPEAEALSAQYHPAWDRCSPYAKKLHGRNAMIVLGESLDDPVELVICWTKDGKPKGGTAQAIRIAEAHDIPVFNLGDEKNLRHVKTWYA